MSNYRYLISIQPVNSTSQEVEERNSLSFEVEQHEDLLAIVERVRQRKDLAPGSAEALGVGLKLFAQALLQNKKNPVFEPLLPHFGEFMGRLKGK